MLMFLIMFILCLCLYYVYVVNYAPTRAMRNRGVELFVSGMTDSVASARVVTVDPHTKDEDVDSGHSTDNSESSDDEDAEVISLATAREVSWDLTALLVSSQLKDSKMQNTLVRIHRSICALLPRKFPIEL